MPLDKEKKKLRDKRYREKNKEKKKLNDKLYYEKNKEKIIGRVQEYNKSYVIENSHIKKISEWKCKYGIKLRPNEDWLSVYLYWKTCERCELCNIELIDGTGELNCRNLDHDHDTGFIRNVLCWGCNIKRR
jgi:hypothetical protein